MSLITNKIYKYLIMINGELFCESKSLKEARNRVSALKKVHEIEKHIKGEVVIERKTQITKRVSTFNFNDDTNINDMF